MATLCLVFLTISVAQAETYTPAQKSLRYDVSGRIVGEIMPASGTSGDSGHLAMRMTYDARGLLVRSEDGRLAQWQPADVAPDAWNGFQIFTSIEIAYDQWGRETKKTVIDSTGAITSVKQSNYDVNGNLHCSAVRMDPAQWNNQSDACTSQTIGPQGPDRVTRYIYDGLNRLIKVEKAVGTNIQQDYKTHTYVHGDKIETVVDANGNKATYTYDDFYRLAKWQFPHKTQTGVSSTTDYEEYGYDDNGNRTSLRKRDGLTINYNYDNLNRMTSKIIPAKPGVAAIHTRDVHYEYDLRGLQLKARFDSLTGVGVDNAYDGFGRMTSSINRMVGTSPGAALTLTYEYDANGNRTKITHPDGKYFTYTYDGLNRSVQLDEQATSIIKKKYNTRGNLRYVRSTDWINQVTGSIAIYAYDGVGRLRKIRTLLDGAPNPAAVSNNFGFTYNPASQMVSRTTSNDLYANTAHYDVDRGYAVNGLNQYTTAGPAAFQYDDNGNLTNDGSAAFLYDNENRLVGASGARNAELTYDPLGRLWEINDGTSGNPSKQRLLYDGDALVAEYDYLNNLTRRYVHGNGADQPLIWYEGSAVGASNRRHLFNNWQGSITAVTDATGAAIAVNAYDAYGIPNDTNIGRFSYTGQIWIPELGLYHYKARAYSPTLGRFMQTDPIGYEGGNNLYAYANNNPVNLNDPTGNSPAAPACVVTGPVAPACVAVDLGITAAVVACYAYCDDAIDFVVDGVTGLFKDDTSDSADEVEKKEEEKREKRRKSKPKDAPRGTRPVDQAGLGGDTIHDIKDGIGAAPDDWVGVDANGNVYTTDPSTGEAVPQGHIDDF